MKRTFSSREIYERKPEVMFKRYIKNHQPEYVDKRRQYAKTPEVKIRRKELNKQRRRLCTELVKLMKVASLKDEAGMTYQIKNSHIVRSDKKVVKFNDEGSMLLFEYNDDKDLLLNDYDKLIEKSENKKEFEKLIEAYRAGEIEVPISKKTSNKFDLVVRTDTTITPN